MRHLNARLLPIVATSQVDLNIPATLCALNRAILFINSDEAFKGEAVSLRDGCRADHQESRFTILCDKNVMLKTLSALVKHISLCVCRG